MEDSDHKYTCPRCHHKTNDRTNYIRHLNKQKICKSIYSDIARIDIISGLHPEKQYKCDKCDKSFIHASNLYRHQKMHLNEVISEHVIKIIPPAKNTKGVVYLVTSSIVIGIKLGYWRADLPVLYDRYKTYYGTGVEFYLFPCENCRLLEDIAKNIFKPYNLSLELHCQNYISHYISILSYLCVLSEADLLSIMKTYQANFKTFIEGVPMNTKEPIHVTPFMSVTKSLK